MASSAMGPVGKPSSAIPLFADKLPEEINEMKIRDENVEKVSLLERIAVLA